MKVGTVMVERTMGVEVLDQEVVVVHVERQKSQKEEVEPCQQRKLVGKER
jgi:hypothetical protein